MRANSSAHDVISTHADQELKIIKNPSLYECRLLKCWTYLKNKVVLHTNEGIGYANVSKTKKGLCNS